jgi:xanthosine utilization system XapX-like protein
MRLEPGTLVYANVPPAMENLVGLIGVVVGKSSKNYSWASVYRVQFSDGQIRDFLPQYLRSVE